MLALGIAGSARYPAGPPVVGFINHVALSMPRNGTTAHTIDPSASGAGTVVAGTRFTPTPGRLLLMIQVGDTAGSTISSGWTTPGYPLPIDSSVWGTVRYRTADGSDTWTLTHTNTNVPIIVDVYEFAAGCTFEVYAANPLQARGVATNLMGLTGRNCLVSCAFQRPWWAVGEDAPVTWSWDSGVELVDFHDFAAATPGYSYTATYVEESTASSWAPVPLSSWVADNVNQIVFGVRLP